MSASLPVHQKLHEDVVIAPADADGHARAGEIFANQLKLLSATFPIAGVSCRGTDTVRPYCVAYRLARA
jgi:hypothetical protein